MAERPPGSATPSEEEYRLLEREELRAVLERACEDPRWRQLLLDDPEAALADLPEAQTLQTTPPPRAENVPEPMQEVAGQRRPRYYEECYWYRGCIRHSARRGIKWWTDAPYDWD